LLADYDHFLAAAAASQWDDATVDLTADAAAWPLLPADVRDRIAALIAAFRVGETAVAAELDPFARRCADPVATACFAAQQVDEARHARFFERVVGEVLRVEPATIDALVTPAFRDLFEEHLRAVAAQLDAREVDLAAAVAVYHLLLEGVVFGAGQNALLGMLRERPELPGVRHGVERVALDERWHLGFGARVIQDATIDEDAAELLAAQGDWVAAAWGDLVEAPLLDQARRFHVRRLGAIGLLRGRRERRVSAA
jgi:ribonucleoside-diphosphate reductase beta chain